MWKLKLPRLLVIKMGSVPAYTLYSPLITISRSSLVTDLHSTPNYSNISPHLSQAHLSDIYLCAHSHGFDLAATARCYRWGSDRPTGRRATNTSITLAQSAEREIKSRCFLPSPHHRQTVMRVDWRSPSWDVASRNVPDTLLTPLGLISPCPTATVAYFTPNYFNYNADNCLEVCAMWLFNVAITIWNAWEMAFLCADMVAGFDFVLLYHTLSSNLFNFVPWPPWTLSASIG